MVVGVNGGVGVLHFSLMISIFLISPSMLIVIGKFLHSSSMASKSAIKNSIILDITSQQFFLVVTSSDSKTNSIYFLN